MHLSQVMKDGGYTFGDFTKYGSIIQATVPLARKRKVVSAPAFLLMRPLPHLP